MTKKLSAYGTWHVTTEGDVEGRTTADLGVHEGYLDDIAFALGGKAYYSLHFEAARELPPPKKLKPVSRVHVTLDIGSGTWDMDAEQRRRYFERLFSGRDVEVEKGTFYASVLLKRIKE
jgi:hypothetical protein